VPRSKSGHERRAISPALLIGAGAAAGVALLTCVALPLAIIAVRTETGSAGTTGSSGRPAASFDQELTNSIGMELTRLPPGTFTMGSPPDEKDRGTDEEQHTVEITQEFWLGVHEVTQAQYRQVMGSNPSSFHGPDRADFPVERVSWHDAVSFCEKLSSSEAESGRQYRLPTEAEWEYACRARAPSSQVFHFGASLSSGQANFDSNFPYATADRGDPLKRTCKVGSYLPNRFGLHDMHGNVLEWCADWYAEDYYRKSPRSDPAGPSDGSGRVVRGGGWSFKGRGCRSAFRFRHTPELRFSYLGFRVVVVPASP
jgi:formylglycine-generating enzyme required for sulfatase activity